VVAVSSIQNDAISQRMAQFFKEKRP